MESELFSQEVLCINLSRFDKSPPKETAPKLNIDKVEEIEALIQNLNIKEEKPEPKASEILKKIRKVRGVLYSIVTDKIALAQKNGSITGDQTTEIMSRLENHQVLQKVPKIDNDNH